MRGSEEKRKVKLVQAVALALLTTFFTLHFLLSFYLSLHSPFAMSSTNAALAWAAEQTATFYSLLASKLKEAGDEPPAGSLFEGVRGMQLALAGAGDDDGEGSKKGSGKRSKKSKADKPKRPPSAYNVFVLQESAKLKAAGFKSDKEHSKFFWDLEDRRDWSSRAPGDV